MDQIVIETDGAVPMRDGMVLRADIYRRPDEGPFPVLVSRGPYGTAVCSDVGLSTREMVRAGYIVVHQNTRGRFDCQGEWMPWKYEREDGYDAVELAVHATSSNFPRWDRSLNRGEPATEATNIRVAHHTFYRDSQRPSWLTLPMVND